jgi:hypothetical protein
MHWSVAVVALTLLAFAAISPRIDGAPITAAMFFTVVGLVVGSEASGLVHLPPAGETVKLLAEATLALVLFADASCIYVRAVRGELAVRCVCSGSARLQRFSRPFSLLLSCFPSSFGPKLCFSR